MPGESDLNGRVNQTLMSPLAKDLYSPAPWQSGLGPVVSSYVKTDL